VLKLDLREARKFLFLGSHSDDIEIGCGGTILTLTEARTDLEIRCVIFSASSRRKDEARKSGKVFLKRAGKSNLTVKSFRESYFPADLTEIKNFFETLKPFAPDVVFTHYRNDRHQDHRVLSDLAWNTFRDHLILEYEVPKYDGDLGQPNFFVPLDPAVARRKARDICAMFKSQGSKHWFSEDAFLALMRLRGIECATEFAEGFYCRKLVCAP